MAGNVDERAFWATVDRLETSRDAGLPFGEDIAPPQREDGTVQFPYFANGEVTPAFVQAAYDARLVVPCDWAAWRQEERGARLFSDPDAMGDATEEEVVRVLTAVIRSDRFVDGAIASAMESGLVFRALDRLRAIRRSQAR